MNDPIGQAVSDFYYNNSARSIIVNSNYTEDEVIDPSYLFRTLDEMPQIEKRALELCQSKVLDIGAGAGCHSIVLQQKGIDVTAIDTSTLSCKVLCDRGISSIINENILNYHVGKYHTLLLLMNGTGIAEDLAGLEKLLNHLKGLLLPQGQILIDSSDIKYLFQEEDGSTWIDLNQLNYYGEMTYELSYKEIVGEPFKWLFVDFSRLEGIANKCGLSCEKVMDGDYFDYLARLTIGV